MERLDSIKNPQPRPPPQTKKPQSQECTNPECNQKKAIEEDGKIICSGCGSVIDELTMVTEVTYGLAIGGQHIVHGYHVGADQAYARRGDVVDKTRAATSQEQTQQFGRNHILRIGAALGINGQIRDHAQQIFRLGIGPGGFTQGRRLKSVAAVALYIACRVQTDPNTHMLIDFSDILALNVFDLGQMYTKFLQYLALNGNGYIVQPINPEDLILRFAQRLEFGNETMRVANDAVRIVQRMNRDWMTPGRRPAGVCGAALILAARMNNFRRSVEEVVFVVKVQEQTIFNRLDEFRATESGALTVEEFRSIDLERAADPPAFTQDKNGRKKRGRKRKKIDANFGDDGDGVEPTVISSRATSTCPSETNGEVNTPANTQSQAQLDSQSMPPPPLPIDPSLLADSPQPSSEQTPSPSPGNTKPVAKRRSDQSSSNKATVEPPAKRRKGRPPGGGKSLKTPPATQISDESPLDVHDPSLGSDLTAALTDPMNLDHATALTSALESASGPLSPPATQQSLPVKPRIPIPDTEVISDSEFADDPEVCNCLLTPSEITIKTRIWTHENRDYLRAQSAKILKQQLAEENGTARIIVRRRRLRKRMGDLSDYLDGDGQEGMPVAGSPQEAVMKMMGKRAFSRKINYESITNTYGGSSTSSSRRGSDAILAGSPGSGVMMSGALQAASPKGRDGDGVAEDAVEVDGAEEAPKVAGRANTEEQKALDSIAEEVEEEIDDSSDDAADDVAEDEDPYGNDEVDSD